MNRSVAWTGWCPSQPPRTTHAVRSATKAPLAVTAADPSPCPTRRRRRDRSRRPAVIRTTGRTQVEHLDGGVRPEPLRDCFGVGADAVAVADVEHPGESLPVVVGRPAGVAVV